MWKYILKRLALMVPVIAGVSFIIFTIMSFMPGNPARMLLGFKATPEAIAQLEEELGLNDPIPVRYVNYMKDALRGDFGKSWSSRNPVVESIAARFPTTLKLACLSVLFATLIGLPLGIFAAVKRGSIGDTIAMIVSFIGVSMPSFWLALLLIMLFSVKLEWLPFYGITGPESFVLPALTLGSSTAANIARLTRTSMLEILGQDYIRTAKAKGLSSFMTLFKHALRNALLPVIAYVGPMLASLMTGSFVVEKIFTIPGLGREFVSSITNRDYTMIMGTTIILAALVIAANVLVDILYKVIDPRIKLK